MIFSKQSLNDAHVTEYFAITDKDFSTLSYYGSQIWVWLRPGGTSPYIIIEKRQCKTWESRRWQPWRFQNHGWMKCPYHAFLQERNQLRICVNNYAGMSFQFILHSFRAIYYCRNYALGLHCACTWACRCGMSQPSLHSVFPGQDDWCQGHCGCWFTCYEDTGDNRIL